MKNMLIVGRFQPFHLGHLAIIKKYNKKKFFVKIVIGSSQKAHQKNNPFTKEERIEMIKNTLDAHKIKKYKIIFVPDVPSDEEWVELVKKRTGKIDVLFTGNAWVKKAFKKENIEIHEYNEKLDRIKGIKAKDIRKNLTTTKTKKGLPTTVYDQLKIIRAFDRLKEMNDPKKKVHYLLKANKLTISTAESCTGGLIGKSLISYSGASSFYKGGIIAYSAQTKQKNLKVKKATIQKKGIVSAEVAREMAQGALNLFKTNYAISTTGYADPTDKQAGTVYICALNKKEDVIKKFEFKNKDRNKIIEKTTKEAIKMIYQLLKKDILKK